MLVMEKSYNVLSLLLLLLAGVVLYAHRPKVSTHLRWLVAILLANVFLALANFLFSRNGISGVEKPLKMLLLVPLLLAISQKGLREQFLYIGVTIGMLLAAAAATYQYNWLGILRPGVHYNPLPFSEVAMSGFAVLLGASAVQRGRQKFIYIVGMLAALYCVLLSGSRGSLLAIFPMGCVLLLWLGWRGQLSLVMTPRRVLAVVMIVIAAAAVAWNSSIFVQRVGLVSAELEDYFENRVTQNNVGIRLEMWRGALLAATEYPFLGVGVHSRESFIQEKVDAGELMPTVLNLHHAHSEYFEGLQTNGLLGLAIVIGLFGVPLWLFLRYLRQVEGIAEGMALGGAMVVMGYSTYSLTEVPLHNSLTVMFYAMYLAVSLGVLEHARHK